MRHGSRRARWRLALIVGLSIGPTAPVAAPGSHPALPDSVLAVIGTGRKITISDFARAWSEGPAPATHDPPTPESARRFLDLLIDREVLVQEALRRARSWTAEESAQYRALRDRLTLGAALDSALAESRAALQAAGLADPDPDLVGIAARDSAASRLGTVMERPLLERLARAWAALPRPTADSSLASQVRTLGLEPSIDPADLDRVVARSALGNYLVRDLVQAWRRLSPVQRPRIETADQLADLVRNGVFERALRRAADSQGLERGARVAGALVRERERLAVSHLVGDEVFSPIERDTLGLLRYFRAHEAEFALPLRVRALRLTLPSRAEAEKMALRLRDRPGADSLEAAALRLGLDYRVVVSAASDSALFAAATRAGTGAVIGPERSGNDWWVARVEAIVPPATPRFEEVRGEVARRRLEDEGELGTRALCEGLRRRVPIVVNDAAVRRLSAAGKEPK